MAKIKVSELAQLHESDVNKYTSLLAVDNNQSYQLKYGFLSSNLSSNLYRPITETVSAECDIQQQKDDIAALSATSKNLRAEIQQSTQTLASEIDNKIDKTTIATSTNLGLIKVGYYTNSAAKNYAVQLDESYNAYVNVPWQGGSGGSDPAVDILKSISSFYAGGNAPLYTDKVNNIANGVTQLTNKVNEVSATAKESQDEIENINDIIDTLYEVGSIYTTTNEVQPTIEKLKELFPDADDNPSTWREIPTILSNSIHFIKRLT